MIDYKAYREIHPRAQPFWFKPAQKGPIDSWPDVIHPSTELLDNRNLLVLQSQIHGFSFKKKAWSKFVTHFQATIHAAQ